MIMKKVLICTVLCLGILSFNSLATADINDVSFASGPESFVANWGWNPEAADTATYTSQYWDASLTIADGGTTWDVTWGFVHWEPYAHGESTNTFSKTLSFSKDSYGLVISDLGSDPHSPHADDWTFQFNRSADPSQSTITLAAVHAPEPVSSTLFVVGAATLGFRRFRKMKKG